MELVTYQLCDIELMMVDIEGTLYCSTPQLEKVFGAHKGNLNRVIRQYPKEFTDTRLSSLGTQIDDLSEFKKALLFKRLKGDARLWSEDDVLGLTWLWRSDIARKCRVQFKEILKQHAVRNTVSKSAFNKILESNAKMAEQLESLRVAVEELQSERKQFASNAGRSLRLVRNKP